jgi:hypothetical protein
MGRQGQLHRDQPEGVLRLSLLIATLNVFVSERPLRFDTVDRGASLDVLAAKERRKIVVSDELCVVVDAKTVRIPQTLFQNLGYRFITPEHVIFSFDCDTFRYWTALNRTEVEAGLKEADGILGGAPPAVS